jgi:hypothetical protein
MSICVEEYDVPLSQSVCVAGVVEFSEDLNNCEVKTFLFENEEQFMLWKNIRFNDIFDDKKMLKSLFFFNLDRLIKITPSVEKKDDKFEIKYVDTGKDHIENFLYENKPKIYEEHLNLLKQKIYIGTLLRYKKSDLKKASPGILDNKIGCKVISNLFESEEEFKIWYSEYAKTFYQKDHLMCISGDYQEYIVTTKSTDGIFSFWEKCQLCNKVENLKMCSKCKKVRYCSRECQVNDWVIHKNNCK